MIVRDFIRCVRIRQWSKNIIIFAALIFSNNANQFQYIMKSFIAFIIFSLGAGAFYIFNDIIDIDSDREHPIKKHRPIASGNISIKTGWILFFMLGAISIFMSFWFNIYFGFVVLSYFLLQTLYTLC